MTKRTEEVRFKQNPQNEKICIKRQKGLLIGLLAGTKEGFYTNSIETGVSKKKLSELISSNFKQKERTNVSEMLHFLRTEGDRTAYSLLLPHLLAPIVQSEQEKAIREHFFGIELFIHYIRNIQSFLTVMEKKSSLSIEKEDMERGILAWDMGRLVVLARMAYETGSISKEEAWEHIEFAGERCEEVFHTWREAGKSYLLGQAMISRDADSLEQLSELFLLAAERME